MGTPMPPRRARRRPEKTSTTGVRHQRAPSRHSNKRAKAWRDARLSLSDGAEAELSTTHINSSGPLNSAPDDAENEPDTQHLISTTPIGSSTEPLVSSATPLDASSSAVSNDRAYATSVNTEIGFMLFAWTMIVIVLDLRGALAAAAAGLARVFSTGTMLQIASALCALAASILVSHEFGTVIGQAALTSIGALATSAHRRLFRKPCDAAGRAAT